MRYPATEKLEIIQLVQRSHLPAKQTLDKLGIPRTTFYCWYAHYRAGGEESLQDKTPLPGRIWNRIPDDIRERLIALALDRPELSPRELAVTFTDTQGYFVSGSSVYRLLKAHDLITSPAFIVMKAAREPSRLFTSMDCITWKDLERRSKLKVALSSQASTIV